MTAGSWIERKTKCDCDDVGLAYFARYGRQIVLETVDGQPRAFATIVIKESPFSAIWNRCFLLHNLQSATEYDLASRSSFLNLEKRFVAAYDVCRLRFAFKGC